MPYRQLTLDERRAIFRLLDAKLPVAEIADQLGRHRSTIHREIGRNLFREVKECRGYFPITADDRARRRRQRRRKLIRDARLRQHATEMLARWWSPERIAGRLKLAGDEACLSHETVYQFVHGSEGRALELHRHLLRARRLRRRRFGRKPRGPKIPLPRTFGQRPAEIGQRQEPGHWEADLLIFQRAHGKANLTSLVERQSRLVRLVPNRDRRSHGVIGAIGDALAGLPPADGAPDHHLRPRLGVPRLRPPGQEPRHRRLLLRPAQPVAEGQHRERQRSSAPPSPWRAGPLPRHPCPTARDRGPHEHHAPRMPRLQDAAGGFRRRGRLAGRGPARLSHFAWNPPGNSFW
jgi:IS30 family transposase